MSLAAVALAATLSSPAPIQSLIDVHCDPMAIDVQLDQYLSWVTWVGWGLDAVEAHAGRISFLSSGEFMEWVLVQPEDAGDLIVRLAASGDDFLGTHSHNTRRVAQHVWQPTGTGAPFEDIW